MKAGVIAFLIYVTIILASLYGWVMNIVSLIGSNFDPLTGLVVARIVGIFVAPLGIVLGYF